MRSRTCLCCGAATLLVLVAPAAAAARLAPISGKLSKPGYTLIALADSGTASSVLVKKHSFNLRPSTKKVTLQLRAPDGLYAGPVVVGEKNHGKVAIVGVMAGAKLGKVVIKGGKGYAKLQKNPAARFVNTKRTATAKKGVPIGAGKFGLVQVKKLKGPSSDPDLDGVPNTFDIDDNGNLILDKVDPPTPSRAHAAQAESPFYIGTSLFGGWYGNAVNANVRAVTDADIDQSLVTNQWIAIGILPGSPELDCGGAPDPNNPQGWIGGLSYCTRGGTGDEAMTTAGVAGYLFEPFPVCCDPDGNGYGTLPNTSHFPPPGSFSLKPNATSSQIGTGDVLIQRVTSNDVTTETPTMLPYVFATAPALVSYDDGQGNAAAINYPVDQRTGPGIHGNGFPVAAGPNGDVALKLAFWPPQRKSIPPEPGAWTDIGKLTYGANIISVGASTDLGSNTQCPASAYSFNDPNLTRPTDPGVGVTDLATDQPANPAHTITYTLNATNCLAAHGFAWNPGEEAQIHFWAVDGFTSSASATEMWAVFTRR
ncbi:MAG: hypothetical protein WBM00_01030 [Solirubrobacterales bacterium]